MALTPEEKQQILDALDELDRQEKKKVLSSLNSFLKWLALILYAVYLILTKEYLHLQGIMFGCYNLMC